MFQDNHWGYDGLELPCWGDHFDVPRALAEPDYVARRGTLLERYGLQCWTMGAHLVGQAVCDRLDDRHRNTVPPKVRGTATPRGNGAWAPSDEGHSPGGGRFGVNMVTGFTGSSMWHLLYSFPPNISTRSSGPTAKLRSGWTRS